MQIQPFTQTNINKPAFGGQVFYGNAKRYPERILKALKSSEFLNEMSLKNDVVVHLVSKRTSKLEQMYTGENTFYNVSFSILKENSPVAKFLDKLNLVKRHYIAHNLYPEMDIVYRLKDENYTQRLMQHCSFQV